MISSLPRLQTRALAFLACLPRIVAAVLLVIPLVLPALSQQTGANTGVGFPPFGSFAGANFDTVNEGNLNVHFSIPVFQKSGRGLSVSAVLTYDSLIWSAVPAPRDSNGNIDGSAQWMPPTASPWGWNLSPVSGYVTYTRTQTPPGSCGTLNNGNGIYIRSDYTYHAPDGTGHYMGAGQAVEADCNGTPHGLGQVMTQDGSGYSLSVDTGMNVYVTDVGGDLILPWQFNGPGGAFLNSGVLIDTNGNQLTVSAGGALTDTLGTQAMQFSTTSTSLSATYPSPTNPTNFVGVTINYSNYYVKTAFLCSGLGEYSSPTVQLVSSISLADGSTYSFSYEPTPGASGKTTGRIASVTLPTGGVITYAYPNSPIDCSDGSTRQLTRTTPDGQWTYTRQITETAFSNGNPGTITSSITTVTNPLGNKSVINFGKGDRYESKRQIYSGSSTLLETIETCYNGATFPCTGTQALPPFTRRTVRKELPDTTGKVAETDTNIAAWGLPTDVYEYDFGSGAPGLLVRHTATTYASLTSNILYNPNLPSYATTIYNRPATVTVTDGSGATQSQTSYFYDETTPTPTSNTPQHVSVTGSSGNLTTTKRLVQGTTTIQKTTAYNDTGTIATDTDFDNNATTYAYGSASCGNSFPTTVTNPLWLEKTTVWDCNGGVATSVKDQNNQFTYYTYGDPNYWRLTATAFPDTGGTTTTYNLGTNRPWNIIQTTMLTSTQNITNKTIYDTLARVTQQQLTTDPEGIDYTDTTYDAAGHVHSVSNPYRTTSDPTYGLTSYVYDGLGRVCLTVPPDGTAATGSACPATRAAGDMLTTYSANCTTVTDQTGQVRKSCVDGLGRLTQVFEDPAGLNYETDYSYNTLDDLLSITQKGGTINSAQWRTRSFTYDSLSRLVCAANPEVQSVTCPSSASGPFPAGAITYTYDGNDNVLTKVSPSPNQPSTGTGLVTTTYSYDALNRLTGKSYVDTYAPNPATSPALYGYDGRTLTGCPADNPPSNTDSYPKGQRTSMCDGSEAATWTHDQMGRTKQESRSIGTIIGQHDNDTYNLDGSVATTTSLGLQYSYTYSGAGRPISASGFVQSGTVTYAPFGGLTSAKMGPTPITITNAYNNRLQPLLISATGASTIMSLCYDFHLVTIPANNPTSCKPPAGSGDNGNVFQIVNNRDNNRTQNFLYDSLNRISQAYTSGSNWGETFGPSATNPGVPPTTPGIDAWGNLTNRSGVNGKSNMEGLSCAVDAQNHLGSCSLTYDAAGNVIANGNAVYTYDAENRLIATAGMSYKYDGDGKRVEKCTAGTTPGTCATNATGTLYWTGWGNDPLAETDLAGNVLENYIFFNGQRIARREPGTTPTIHFYFSDHLGSHGMVTDKTGGICEQDIDYYPYGGVENDYCGTIAQHYKFTGKERDSESGLDNFGARYMGSSLGRFMSPDPMGGHLTDPQTLNRYAYVRNNPLSLTDPTGLDFALSCTQTKDNGSTCQSQQVGTDKDGNAVNAFVQGTTDANGKFTSTQIGDDGNGGLVDKTTGTGAYSANVTGGGVQFSQDGGKTSTGGVFVNGTDPTHIQGSGDLSGFSFTFTNSKLEANQTAAGTFTFSGTENQAGQALMNAGFVSMGWFGRNKGFDEFRSTGSGAFGENSAHFNVEQVERTPSSTVPTSGKGNMHFGEHFPLSLGVVDHILESNK